MIDRNQKIELLKARMQGKATNLFPVFKGCDVTYHNDDNTISFAETESGHLTFDPPITEQEFDRLHATKGQPIGYTTKVPVLVGIDYENYLKGQKI